VERTFIGFGKPGGTHTPFDAFPTAYVFSLYPARNTPSATGANAEFVNAF
jgi:hypothetical protein